MQATERIYDGHPYAPLFHNQIAIRDARRAKYRAQLDYDYACRRGDSRAKHMTLKALQNATNRLLQAELRGRAV